MEPLMMEFDGWTIVWGEGGTLFVGRSVDLASGPFFYYRKLYHPYHTDLN